MNLNMLLMSQRFVNLTPELPSERGNFSDVYFNSERTNIEVFTNNKNISKR